MPEKIGYLMYRTNTSLKRLGGAELFGWLLLSVVILSGFPASSKGLEKPDLKKPFKKCLNYDVKNGLLHIVASDNESQLIISNNNSSLISIDPKTKLQNWKSEINGNLLKTAISDENSLFFLTEFKPKIDSKSVDKEKKENSVTLNSISLKTGITKWQKKISESLQTEIKLFYNKDLIFITDENKNLSAVEKADGTLRWRKNFSNLISSVDSTIPAEIKVLTENQLIRINSNTGEILEEAKVENNSAKNFVLRENYLILGNSTGEIIKVMPSENKSSIRWKIKTGGSISNLLFLNEGVLATSLDNFMYLFSPESGKLKWKRRVNGRITHSPLVFDGYAVVINSADNYATIVDLRDGKIVNQLQIEDENYFSGVPLIFRNLLILQTYKGIFFFTNTDVECL